MSCHHTPVRLHFGSDLDCDLSQQTFPARDHFLQSATLPTRGAKARVCSLRSAAKTNVLHSFIDSLIHSENHHVPPVWPCSSPLAQQSRGLMDPHGRPLPGSLLLPGRHSWQPGLQEDVLLPPCGQEDPSRLSSGSSPLLGPEKDLPRLLGSVASAGRASTLISGSSGKYLRGTRYKVPWDSRARGRPSSSHHGTTPLHSMPLQGVSNSPETSWVSLSPPPPGHSRTCRRPLLSGPNTQSSTPSSRVGSSPSELPVLWAAHCSASRDPCLFSPRTTPRNERDGVFSSPRTFRGVSVQQI